MSNAARRVLVVDDDPAIRARIHRGLVRAGYDVVQAADGDEAAAALRDESLDLVLLDLMLPGCSGETILELLAARPYVPVIVVSAKSQLDSRLNVFSLGAVDFIPKPFWMEELLVRVRARLSEPPPASVVRFGPTAVNLDSCSVHVDGTPVELTPAEQRILFSLIRNAGRVLTREALARAAGGGEDASLERTVDSHLSRLRRKLGGGASAIRTVRGLGYLFEHGAGPP